MILEQAQRLADLTEQLSEALMTAAICADAGKTAHYMLHLVSTTVEKGPPALDGPPRTKSAVAQDEEQPAEGLSEEEEAMRKLKEAISVEKKEVGLLRLKLTVTVPQEMPDERRAEYFAELKRDLWFLKTSSWCRRARRVASWRKLALPTTAKMRQT